MSTNEDPTNEDPEDDIEKEVETLIGTMSEEEKSNKLTELQKMVGSRTGMSDFQNKLFEQLKDIEHITIEKEVETSIGKMTEEEKTAELTKLQQMVNSRKAMTEYQNNMLEELKKGANSGGRKRRGKKSRKSRKSRKGRKGKKSRKNKRRTKRR